MARRRLMEIAEAVAGAHGCKAAVEITEGYPVTYNHPEACQEVERSVSKEVPMSDEGTPCMGGEDFAYYGEKIPAAFMFLGNRDEDQGIVYFCHHPRFQVDDPAMEVWVRTWLALALGADQA